MFRILGILIVALILIVIVAYLVDRKVVRPARNRKHVAELEAENQRLDALLNRLTIPRKKDPT